MSAERDNVPDLVFDMEDVIGELETASDAFVMLTGKYDDGNNEGAIPYPVCVVLSDAIVERVTELRVKWRRLFDLTREPCKVAQLRELIQEDLAEPQRHQPTQ